MNLSVSTLLFCFFALISILEAKKVSSSKKCSQALAGIIYTPETCAYQYLNNLSKQFLASKELLFATPSVTESYIYSFTAAYNIDIELGDAVGSTTTYSPNKTSSPGSPERSSSIAHSNLNVPGFTKGSTAFYFTFIVYSDDAEMYYVKLILPLTQTPVC